MDTIETRGNTQYGQTAEPAEAQRPTERRSWGTETEPMRPGRGGMRVAGSGSIVEIIGGLAATVLGIVAVSQVEPAYTASVACLIIGVTLLISGAAVAFGFRNAVGEMTTGRGAPMRLGIGVTTKLLAGLAGIVLGIVALSTLVTWTLLAISALVFGAALLITSDLAMRANYVGEPSQGSAFTAGRGAVFVAAGLQIAVGLVTLLFGLLALVGIRTVLLSEIAMLIVGVSIFVTGCAVAWRMMGARGR